MIFWGVTILQGVEFPIFLLIFAWALMLIRQLDLKRHFLVRVLTIRTRLLNLNLYSCICKTIFLSKSKRQLTMMMHTSCMLQWRSYLCSLHRCRPTTLVWCWNDVCWTRPSQCYTTDRTCRRPASCRHASPLSADRQHWRRATLDGMCAWHPGNNDQWLLSTSSSMPTPSHTGWDMCLRS